MARKHSKIQPAIDCMTIKQKHFGTTPGGCEIHLFTLTNSQGMEVSIINYGGIVTTIKVPDRTGRVEDVVLGHDTLEGYLNRSRFFGALIGRYANRIARGRFVLHGIEYSLGINNGVNHLHGGFKGFDKVVWLSEELTEGLRLTYFSQDGEENYPGNLRAKVSYSLSEANELRVEYQAETDQDTIVNLTNHSYFNLAGGGTILDHELTIEADAFTPVDHTLIPCGEIRNVKETPFDFTSPTPVGMRINTDDEQLWFAGGYDHNFVLRTAPAGVRKVASLHDPKTGRLLEISTEQPGIQFYSGNYLDGSIIGKGGRAYVKYSGCCLETQHFPDSPNHPNFPPTVLRPGKEYRHTTVFKFSVL
jgi:aldose 1-epimerase